MPDREPTLRRRATCASLILLLVIASRATDTSAATIELPLGQWCRPGQFVPLRVTPDGPGDTVALTADVATTEVTFPTGSPVVVPVLIGSEAAPTVRRPGGFKRTLVPLGRQQRLVVLDGADEADAAGLFRGDDVVSVRASVTGPAIAWACADAVVFAREPSPDRTRALLAAGVAVCVVTDLRPEGALPWERLGATWAARAQLAGPSSSRIAPAVFDAAALSPVGRPVAARRRAVLLAALFAVAATGAALLAGARATVAVVGVCVVASLGLAAWARANDVGRTTRLRVIVNGEGFAQQDDWTFERSPSTRRARFDAAVAGWPLFGSLDHAGNARPVVAAGQGDFATTLTVSRHAPAVFLNRQVDVLNPAPTTLVTPDPTLGAFGRLYASPGVKVLGMTTGPDGTPTLWLAR